MLVSRIAISEESIVDAVENLRVSREGIYHIDVDSLLKGTPLVMRAENGVYFIGSRQPKDI